MFYLLNLTGFVATIEVEKRSKNRYFSTSPLFEI